MNLAITNNNLSQLLKEDLCSSVGSQDLWSQGGTDNIFVRSNQYYTTNGDRLPEPDLPDKLMHTRQYLLAPVQPCKY